MYWALSFISLQIDYFERAKRLEEIPLIKKAYEEQRVKDMELWELQEEERVSGQEKSALHKEMKTNVKHLSIWNVTSCSSLYVD